MEKTRQEKLGELAFEIKSLAPELQKLCDAARKSLATPAPTEPALQVEYFRSQILAYSMLRIRHFIEHNLINSTYIETMATLAVCRYTFELVVWLKLMEKDNRFALLFNRESIRGRIDNLKENISLLESEQSFYISQANTERDLHRQAIEEIKANDAPPEEKGMAIARQMEQISDYLDITLNSKLLHYYDEIAKNGYGYVANFIKTKALPIHHEQKEKAEAQLEEFDKEWSASLKELNDDLENEIKELHRKPKKVENMTWKAKAQLAGVEGDYDFIYAYTSRLLHATPSSVMTLEQNLREEEFLTFWRYIRIQFRWIADLGFRMSSVLDNSDAFH
jgi:hypothetical protein